jgi:hypothetical protein
MRCVPYSYPEDHCVPGELAQNLRTVRGGESVSRGRKIWRVGQADQHESKSLAFRERYVLRRMERTGAARLDSDEF